MIYIEYEDFKNKYYAAQREYDKILNEKEILFVKTQPKSTKYDKEVVGGGSASNAFDEYLIQKEKRQIDERLEEAKSILEDRKRLLTLKEEELKASTNYFDRIYYLRYIENTPVKNINYKIPYCKSNIYNMLKIINRNIAKK